MPDKVLCPFCRTEFPADGRHMMCGGSFLDRGHPSAVRPILVWANDDGSLDAEQEQRLAEAKASYA